MLSATLMMGLSPPTRGILSMAPAPYAPMRSIPAYAGDPIDLSGLGIKGKVYPRLRGGSAPLM